MRNAVASFFPSLPTDFTVRLGDSNNEVQEGSEQEFGIQRIIVHEEYSITPSPRNDIALIKLSSSNGSCSRYLKCALKESFYLFFIYFIMFKITSAFGYDKFTFFGLMVTSLFKRNTVVNFCAKIAWLTITLELATLSSFYTLVTRQAQGYFESYLD